MVIFLVIFTYFLRFEFFRAFSLLKNTR
uniref:Uncharacterized protein n=1 Tax=Rhizophora mucronata TaxID=61149 RepID=A0A2P2N1E9_RHIMU